MEKNIFKKDCNLYWVELKKHSTREFSAVCIVCGFPHNVIQDRGLAMRDLHYQTRDSTFQIPGINPRNLEIGSKILVFTFLEDKTVSQNNTNSIFCIFKNSKERERQTDRQTERSPNLYWCSFGWFLSLSLLIFPFLHIYICLHSKDNIWE